MSTHSKDSFIIEEEIIEVPLADDSHRSSGRSLKRRSSGQSADGSIHSYTFEEVESVYSEYTMESLNDSSSSLHNSFSSSSDVLVASTPPPAAAAPPRNVAVPRDSLIDMKNFLRSELGLDIPPKKEEKKEAPKRSSALDDMKNFLRSELGIDVPPPKESSSSVPKNSAVAASLDLPISSFSMDKAKTSNEAATFGDSELARSIAFLKEGVDVEEIEYIMSDEEFGDEIIDDIFDHMGGLDGRDTVILESYGLAAIPEISHSEYESDMDDSVQLARTSEISMLSTTEFPLVIGDVGSTDDDEVDTKPIKPNPTGLHETATKSEEATVKNDSLGSMDVDESISAENRESSPQKSGKAAKWKDRIKKKRSKSDKGNDEMDIDSSPTDRQTSQEAQHSEKVQSPESKAESSKGNESDASLAPTKTTELQDSSTETKERKAKKGKTESQSKPDKKESELSSPKNKRGKKAAKWKDRIQKKRNKTGEGSHEIDISAPNSPASPARAEINATDAAENDLKDSTHLPIHEENAKSKQEVQDETQPSDVVMKVDGLGQKADTAQGKKTQSAKKEDGPKDKTLFRAREDRTDTIGEIDGDEDNNRGDSGGTTHSMRIFDDEFGSVSAPSPVLERSNVSFDLSLSNDNDSICSETGSGSIVYEMELKDEPDNSDPSRTFSKRDDSVRSLRGVFDDELGETSSYARSSIYSMHSSGALEELDDADKDDEIATSNDEGESLQSKEDSGELNEGGKSTGSSNKTRTKSSHESNGGSQSSFKFELPNELLEAIHCHHNNKNVNEKQSDQDSSDVLRTQNETPAEKEKDGSATYSTLPPTVEDSSRTLGEEVAETTDAGVPPPDLIDEESQDFTQSDDETAGSTDVMENNLKVQRKARRRPKGPRGSGKSAEKESINDATRGGKIDDSTSVATNLHCQPVNEVERSVKQFPGRLAPNRRVVDNASGKSTSFIAAYEMVTKHRRREIVLRSAEIASEVNLSELGSANDWKNKYSRDVSISDRQKLVELLNVKLRMVTRAGRKKLVMESIKATMPIESWADRILSRQDELDKQTTDTKARTNQDSTARDSTSSRGSGSSRVSGRKASSKVSGSKSSKADGRNGSDSSKVTKGSSKNKKRAKGNGVSRSQSTENLASSTVEKKSSRNETEESLSFDSSNHRKEENSKNGKGKTARSPERNDTPKTKNRKRSKTRNRKTPGRSKSLGTEDFLESLKPKEGMNETGANSEGKEDTDDKGTKSRRNRTRGVRRSLSMGPMEGARAKKRKEKRSGEGDDATAGSSGDDRKEKRGDLSPQSSNDKDSEEEDPNVLLSPGTRRRRKDSVDKSSKVEKSSLRRRKSGDVKSPRNSSRKSLDKIRSPTAKKKSVDLLNSPSLRKKSVDLSEDLKHETKSPKKGRSSINDTQSPKAGKPSLRRRKSSGDGKSPRNSSRKSLDKIRSPAAKKKSLSSIPDLEEEVMSPKKNQSGRRSMDVQLPRTPGKKNGKRRHSDSPMEETPTVKQQSAFMEYYDSVREGRRSIVADDLAALQVPSFQEQRKSALRRGQSDSATEVIAREEDATVVVDDIWGLVKWRDQVDRTATSRSSDL